jgi:molecular chaperone GrpE (heat shock protein)
MSKVLVGVILIMSLGGYYLWNENAKLQSLNQAFELRDQEQAETIATLQSDFSEQTEGLLAIQARSNEIQQEMNSYLDVFKRHSLTKLATAKPNLIETRANKGTKNVFDSIEEDSRVLDNLDDGLQLQPVSKDST